MTSRNPAASPRATATLLNPVWAPTAPGFRVFEHTELIGDPLSWAEASERLMRWGVKTASGFRVGSTQPVHVGDRPKLRAAGIIPEPVEVIAIVNEPDRVGFAYTALPGHPVSGSEAFLLTRRGESISLTLRSLTAPSDALGWRLLHPLLRLIQVGVRRLYFRALR